MSKEKYPVTPAIRFLKSKNLNFKEHLYNYEEKGGTAQTAKQLGVDEYNIIKTLVFQTDSKEIIIVLMHGTLEVSQKELARQIISKSIEMCSPEKAQKNTGYLFGGTSPFGTIKELIIYAEKTIFDLDVIFINGGKRGFILEMSPLNLNILNPIIVSVGI